MRIYSKDNRYTITYSARFLTLTWLRGLCWVLPLWILGTGSKFQTFDKHFEAEVDKLPVEKPEGWYDTNVRLSVLMKMVKVSHHQRRTKI